MRNRFKMILSLVLMASLPSLSFGQRAGGSSGGMSMPGGATGGYGGAMGGYGGGKGGGGGFGSGGEGGMGYSAGSESFAFTLDGKSLKANRVLLYQYVPHSYRPTEVSDPNGMGGSDMGGVPGMGGGPMGGGPGGFAEGGSPSAHPLTIRAYVLDDAKVDDRTRIELAVEFTNPASAGYPGGYGSEEGGGMGGEGYPGDGGYGGMGGFEPAQMQSFASLGTAKSKSKLKLPESEIKLVSDTIRQTIWRDDVLKELRDSKGQGETAAANERLLKQLMAEQYDTQLARQEMEVESIKRRLESLQEELKRRKQAKDRVVEVQWGRLILDAQGLLNNQ